MRHAEKKAGKSKSAVVNAGEQLSLGRWRLSKETPEGPRSFKAAEVIQPQLREVQ